MASVLPASAGGAQAGQAPPDVNVHVGSITMFQLPGTSEISGFRGPSKPSKENSRPDVLSTFYQARLSLPPTDNGQ